jgi:hypothetical protein
MINNKFLKKVVVVAYFYHYLLLSVICFILTIKYVDARFFKLIDQAPHIHDGVFKCWNLFIGPCFGSTIVNFFFRMFQLDNGVPIEKITEVVEVLLNPIAAHTIY